MRPKACLRAGAALSVALALTGVEPVGGQQLVSLPAAPTASSVTATTPKLRLEGLEARLAAEPGRYDLLVDAAAEGARLATSTWDEDARKSLLARSRERARGAVEQDQDGIDGHYWLAVSSGLLADVEGGRTKIRLADEAWRESSWVLAADSLHAGAHHIQGRLHAGVMRLNRVVRFLAKSLLGGDALDGASWERAEHHLRVAAELAPHEPAYHYELAVAYLDLDREADAKAALEAARGVRSSHPGDRGYVARAEALLAEIIG